MYLKEIREAATLKSIVRSSRFADNRREFRTASKLCVPCFYENVMCGQAFTHKACALCGKDQVYATTNTDLFCNACATSEHACKHCGADMNLDPLRKSVSNEINNNEFRSSKLFKDLTEFLCNLNFTNEDFRQLWIKYSIAECFSLYKINLQKAPFYIWVDILENIHRRGYIVSFIEAIRIENPAIEKILEANGVLKL